MISISDLKSASPSADRPQSIGSKSISRQEQTWLIVALCCITFLLRFAMAWFIYHAKPMEFWAHSIEPERIAVAILNGEGYSSPFTPHTGPTAWNPPLYPLIIAASFKIFGIYSVKAACLLLGINFVCATITTAIMYRIGSICFGPRAAFFGAMFWAISLDTVMWAARNWESSLGALFATLITLWYIRLLQSPTKTRDWVIYGALWGLCGLTTATLLALMPIPMAVLFFRKHRESRNRVMIAFLTTIILLTPWTVRNYLRFGTFIPIRGNFGTELWAGNHPGVHGPLAESLHPLIDVKERDAYAAMGEARFMASRQKLAMDFIRHNPRQFAALTRARIVSFWTAQRVLSSTTNYWCTALTWTSFILLLRKKTRLFAAPFAAALILFPIPYYISHAENYFRFPIEPLLLLLAADTMNRLISLIERTMSKKSIVSLVQPDPSPKGEIS